MLQFSGFEKPRDKILHNLAKFGALIAETRGKLVMDPWILLHYLLDLLEFQLEQILKSER